MSRASWSAAHTTRTRRQKWRSLSAGRRRSMMPLRRRDAPRPFQYAAQRATASSPTETGLASMPRRRRDRRGPAPVRAGPRRAPSPSGPRQRRTGARPGRNAGIARRTRRDRARDLLHHRHGALLQARRSRRAAGRRAPRHHRLILASRGADAQPGSRLSSAHADRYRAESEIDRDVALAVARYPARVRTADLVANVIAGELAALHDPYTCCFRPHRVQEVRQLPRRQAERRHRRRARRRPDDARGARGRRVPRRAPAEAAGLHAGDMITAIDERPAATPADVVRALRGRPGTTVRLAFTRDGVAQPQLGDRPTGSSLPDVTARAEGIGYVRLRSFGARASQQLDAVLATLARSRGHARTSSIWGGRRRLSRRGDRHRVAFRARHRRHDARAHRSPRAVRRENVDRAPRRAAGAARRRRHRVGGRDRRRRGPGRQGRHGDRYAHVRQGAGARDVRAARTAARSS